MTRNTGFLDFFRGVAALWVCLAHCWIWTGGDLPGVFDPKKAVDLFMVLSGFLMVYTIDQRAEREAPERWSTWRSFYLRRFFRIAPAYFVALASAALLAGPVNVGMGNLQAIDPAHWAASYIRPGFQDFGPMSLLLHLTFLFGLFPDFSSSTALPDWSLSLEMQFYWVFPLLYLLLRKTRFGLICLVLSLACFALSHFYWAAVQQGKFPAYPEPSLLALMLPRFLVGSLIYEAGRSRKPLLLALAAGLVLLSVRSMSGALLFVMLIALAALWYLGVPKRLQRALESKPVEYLADLSYSLYLFHGLVLFLIGWPVLSLLLPSMPLGIARVVMAGAVVVASYAVAWLVFMTIERPGMNLGKRSRIATPMA